MTNDSDLRLENAGPLPAEPHKLDTLLSHDEHSKPPMNTELLDKELAQYVDSQPIHIDKQTNRRLKTQIDRRVLVVMIITYFLQSVDKGALGFASIMGLREDTNLHGTEVSHAFHHAYYPFADEIKYSWLTTVIYLVILVVEYPVSQAPPCNSIAIC